MMENIRVYYDDDSNPENPGYVVSYDDRGQVNLTAALDAHTMAGAVAEAAELLGVEPTAIREES